MNVEEPESPKTPLAAELVTVGRPPVCIAHRGASKQAPENTVPAFRRAIEQEADAIELDVRATSEGILVCMHDATLDRTTNGSGPVEKMSFGDMRKLDAGSWMSPEMAGEHVPSFAVGLEAITEGAVCAAELKVTDIEKRVLETIHDCGVEESVIVVSFSEATIAQMTELAPTLARGWIVSEDPPDDRQGHAAGLVARACACGADLISASFTTITEELLEATHEREMPLWVWTIDSEEPMGALLAAGIDGITTNVPHVLRRVMDEGIEEEPE
ncbi:MAG: glycerophosphodiester phosphodiesterase family protein [Armatimonadota bacterium]|jgi:glycerophosphoryl diester phosphodiesterase